MGARRRFGLWIVLLSAVLVVAAGLLRAARPSSPAAMPSSNNPPSSSLTAAPARGQQEIPPERHTVEVVAKRYQFTPARIEVHVNDLVRIVFSTEDIPHSFTIDDYRIAKRAAPGQAVTFDFLANKAGTFVFYCNLTTEEGCKKMRGELVVRPR
jgi:cytochrome c oxidase subunit 2